jgi:hypothetical protein
MPISFDTLKYTKGAEEAGIPRKQAEYQAQELAKLINHNLATKDDLLNMEVGNREYMEELGKRIADRLTIKLGGMMIVCSGVIMSVLGFIMKH